MKKWLTLIILFILMAIGAILVWQWFKRPPEVVKPPIVEMALQNAFFSQMPGWDEANLKSSFNAFKVSCKVFLNQDPEKKVGSLYINMKAKDWHPVCREAMSLEHVTAKKAKTFFETWFKPVQFYDGKPVEGLFTGYYSPLLKGKLKKSKNFNVPIYGLPKDMLTVNLGLFFPELMHKKVVGRVKGNQLIPYFTHEEINKGAIDDKAPVIVWISNRIDRLFLEIQGSGAVELANGSIMYLGYEGENGAPYTSVAQVLIDQGIMTKHNASMQAIRKYLDLHPDQMDDVLHKNKSFVFFRSLGHNAAYGAQGVALITGYSLAVDRKWIPLGTPIWLNTTRPVQESNSQKPFQRLMIAQDTGGAIRGPVRGDVYWGTGEAATYIAGHMKNKGYYWLLLPEPIAKKVAVNAPAVTPTHPSAS